MSHHIIHIQSERYYSAKSRLAIWPIIKRRSEYSEQPYFYLYFAYLNDYAYALVNACRNFQDMMYQLTSLCM